MDAAELLLLMFIIIAALAVIIFLMVAWSTRLPEQPQDEVAHRGYVIRARWFMGFALFLLAAFLATIPFFPYLTAAAALEPAQRVPVVCQQYAFLMPDEFPLNRRILFEVSSSDVTHGFGIYDPQGQLIAQTQAMPDYVNHLAVTFTQPGQYIVRCLEYCGVAHALMEKTLTVGNLPASGGSAPAVNNPPSPNEPNPGATNGASNDFE